MLDWLAPKKRGCNWSERNGGDDGALTRYLCRDRVFSDFWIQRNQGVSCALIGFIGFKWASLGADGIKIGIKGERDAFPKDAPLFYWRVTTTVTLNLQSPVNDQAQIEPLTIDVEKYPLTAYFLSEYLKANPGDVENFPRDQFPDGFTRYDMVFRDALVSLRTTKEDLKKRHEFNFASGDANNLESGIGILRTAIHLSKEGFVNISLVTPPKNSKGADLIGERNDQRVCFEVKTITKQSTGKSDCFLADQVYEKILEGLPTARKQLESSATVLECSLRVYVCVLNWFDQSIYLDNDDFQSIVNKLEKDNGQESLIGVDALMFVTKMGMTFGFVNERAKVLD